MGSTIAYGAIFGGGLLNPQAMLNHMRHLQQSHGSPSPPAAAGPGNYVCPHCGGKLTRADVSPLGDVKCTFCGAWFNVHGKAVS